LSAEDIAEILVSEGEVSEEQMQEALNKRQEQGVSLGEVLVSEGYVAAEDLTRILSRHLNMEYVVLSQEEVDPGLIALVGEETLVQCEAVPIRIEDGKLVVAMSDPADPEARSCVVESAGHPIVPVAAAEDAIRTTREQLLGDIKHEEPPAPSNGSKNGEQQKTTTNRKRPRGPLGSGRMGDILVEEGKISEEQLQQALSMQDNDQRNLGEILLSLGLILPSDLAQALARRLRLEYVVLAELAEGDTDSEAINLMDENACRKYKALPLRFEGDHLVVAMSDPNDLYALEDLRIIARRPITPVVVAEEDLNGALDHLFGAGDGVYEEPDGMYSEVESEPETVPVEEPTATEEYDEDEVETDSATGSEDDEDEIPEDYPQEHEEPPEPAEAPLVEAEQPSDQQPRQRRTLTGSGRIGDILVAEGKISEEQLQRAVSMQEKDSRQIGEIMISLGYVSEADLAQALARRLRLEYIELTDTDVDRGLLTLVDQKVLRRHGAVPLRMQDGRLAVAMSDPKDIYALEDLRMISGYAITPVVATKADIQRAQNKLFALGEDVSEFLQESAEDSIGRDEGEVDLGADAGADEAPIIRLVSSILQQAVGEGASDIHIEPQAQEVTVRFRVDGVLREVMSVPHKLQNGIVARLKVIASLNIAERRVPQDGRFSVRIGGSKVDLRVATLPTVYGEKIVLRLLDTSNVEANLKKLGFSTNAFEKYEEIFTRPYGAILVTGPTGSGKSTTLYATLNELNSPGRNIITVEDPVEYRVPGLNQIQVNPRAGLTFASGLRSILRSDPDVIMIGEIRDVETAKISIESALTGHLVLATLHTNNAPGALTRLTEMGVEPFLTSSAVDCVIAQRLGRRLCERCKQPAEIEREVLEEMNFPFHLVDEENMNFYKACGCDRCSGTGYRGRVGFYEMMIVTDELKDMVLRRVSTNEVARAAEDAGMVRLREDGLVKASQGLTTMEEVLRTVV
jgi:type IV pilus assembly protein PilB